VARRALVSGGAGYFGRVVVEALRARDYEVTVFDLADADGRHEGVRFVRGDIRDSLAVLRASEGMDVIHHNVAAVPIVKDDSLFEAVNVGGARNVLEAARVHAVKKTVLVSSSAVFGVPARNPVDATVLPRPREAYGEAKLRAEHLARTYVDRGVDVSIIRPRTILGRDRLGIFQILFELVRRGRPIYVLGRGDNRYQFVHADDLADACVRAGELAGPAVFNVGASRFGTMREALHALVRHAGTGSPVRSLPMRPMETVMEVASRLGLSPLGAYHSLMYGREMYFDLAPVEDALGWRATRSNEEMLIESYEHYVENRDEIRRRRGASSHRSPIRFGLLRLLELLP
jgi:nucleoside-diphosphate-sugar epimerase